MALALNFTESITQYILQLSSQEQAPTRLDS